MMRWNKYKAIVLDFDGVIVESNHIKHNAFKKLFQEYPEHYDEMWSYHYDNDSISRGEKFNHIASTILNINNTEDFINNWLTKFDSLTTEEIINCNFVNGSLDFLVFFHNKTPLYLASATPTKELNIILKERKLDHYFKNIYGAPINKTNILNQVISNESISSSELLFIGDSPKDYLASLEAKVGFIGRVSDKEFPNEIAYYNDLRQILNYLTEDQP